MSLRIAPAVPSEDDAKLAQQARSALAGGEHLGIQVSAAGQAVDLPPLVTRLLLDILAETAAGNAISLVPVEPEITTHQAAAILNVSRPYLLGLVDSGVLPTRPLGKDRRLPLREVLAYRTRDFARRSEGLDEIAAQDRELGLI